MTSYWTFRSRRTPTDTLSGISWRRSRSCEHTVPTDWNGQTVDPDSWSTWLAGWNGQTVDPDSWWWSTWLAGQSTKTAGGDLRDWLDSRPRQLVVIYVTGWMIVEQTVDPESWWWSTWLAGQSTQTAGDDLRNWLDSRPRQLVMIYVTGWTVDPDSWWWSTWLAGQSMQTAGDDLRDWLDSRPRQLVVTGWMIVDDGDNASKDGQFCPVAGRPQPWRQHILSLPCDGPQFDELAQQSPDHDTGVTTIASAAVSLEGRQ